MKIKSNNNNENGKVIKRVSRVKGKQKFKFQNLIEEDVCDVLIKRLSQIDSLIFECPFQFNNFFKKLILIKLCLNINKLVLHVVITYYHF